MWRERVRRTADQELVFVGMLPHVRALGTG